MIISNYRKSQKYCIYLLCAILTIFIFSCAGNRQLQNKTHCSAKEEKWLPDGHRPSWIDKLPGAKSGFMYFVGQSNKYSTEKKARNNAYQDAVNRVAAFCGVNVKVMSDYISVSQSSSSVTADPNIIEKQEISQEYDAFVSRIKPIEWAVNQAICQYQGSDTKFTHIAHVLVSVPEDEPKKVNEYQKQLQKMGAELRSVFEKVKYAYKEFLADGRVILTLKALTQSEQLLQSIPKDHYFYILYSDLRDEYGFDCDNLSLKGKQIKESVYIEKVNDDKQTIKQDKDHFFPLTVHAFVYHQDQPIPLKNIPVLFQNDQENLLESVYTDSKGLASYQPHIVQPGLYRFKALLNLNGENGETVQRDVSFSLKINRGFFLEAYLDRKFYLAGD